MKHEALYQKAYEMRGCLSSIHTSVARRRFKITNHFEEYDGFTRDETDILASKSYRLLGFKTQVVTSPHNLLVRTRQTHTMEVVGIAVRIAKRLGLNCDLVRAIALGHDIGHVPFGHQGERFLAERMGKLEFCHEVMGPVILQNIERKGKGVNVAHEIVVGMRCHGGRIESVLPCLTPEGWIVRYADKIAYLFADYNDLILRLGFSVPKELEKLMNQFGKNQRERTSTAIAALMIESSEMGKVSFEDSKLAVKFDRIKKLMYQCYVRVTEQDPSRIMDPVLNFLTKANIGNPFLILALMTDIDVIRLASIPMLNVLDIKRTAVGELLPHLAAIGDIDMCDPCLDW